MKHIIILGDGMADHKVSSLGNKTLLQYAKPKYMNLLARMGRTGRLITVPDGFPPGSEVANTSILGYNLNEVYEGRGPLEAASIGYEMDSNDLALRCNLITLENDRILTHNGGNINTEDANILIHFLNENLAKPINNRYGYEIVKFITGIQYRHLLIIKGGSKHITCAPPHDHPGEPWKSLMVRPNLITTNDEQNPAESNRLSPQETAELLNHLIISSQQLLSQHPYNTAKAKLNERQANSIWPWSGGYRPKMQTLTELYPCIKSGSVISAVDLIRGIGHYAGLRVIKVDGATGLANTNYEGKAQAAIDSLKTDDFVFVHVEATDEAGHDGDIQLKLQAIDYLDQRLIKPIYEAVEHMEAPVCIAVLPDHPTPVEQRIHVAEPVPFLIWHPGITPDGVECYDEESCVSGGYGLLRLQEFMQTFINEG